MTVAIKEYYRPDEVADILKVTRKTVYNLCNLVDDPLPSVKIGKTLRISKEEFNLWIEKRKNKPWE